MKKNQIYIGDNVKIMQKFLKEESIDLTVASPPYDDLRTYDGFDWDIDGVIEELWRVTKKRRGGCLGGRRQNSQWKRIWNFFSHCN